MSVATTVYLMVCCTVAQMVFSMAVKLVCETVVESVDNLDSEKVAVMEN
jgi:hypothetical protein